MIKHDRIVAACQTIVVTEYTCVPNQEFGLEINRILVTLTGHNDGSRRQAAENIQATASIVLLVIERRNVNLVVGIAVIDTQRNAVIDSGVAVRIGGNQAALLDQQIVTGKQCNVRRGPDVGAVTAAVFEGQVLVRVAAIERRYRAGIIRLQ